MAQLIRPLYDLQSDLPNSFNFLHVLSWLSKSYLISIAACDHTGKHSKQTRHFLASHLSRFPVLLTHTQGPAVSRRGSLCTPCPAATVPHVTGSHWLVLHSLKRALFQTPFSLCLPRNLLRKLSQASSHPGRRKDATTSVSLSL